MSVRSLMVGKSNDEIQRSLNKLELHDIFKKSCETGFTEGVKYALENNVDPSINNNYAIRIASYYGYSDIIELLLSNPKTDPSAQNNYSFEISIFKGNIDIVKLFLNDSRINPIENLDITIGVLLNRKHSDILKLLLKDKRIKKNLSKSISERLSKNIKNFDI